MNSLTYTLFASLLDDLNDFNRITYYKARDIECCSEGFTIEAEEETEAVKAFQESSIYEQFSINHASQWVYTFVKAKGDKLYHRADLSPAATREVE